MWQLRTLTTDGIRPSQRLDYWNCTLSTFMAHLSSVPRDPLRFWGRMTCADLGELRFIDTFADAGVARRSAAHIARHRDDAYFLRLQLQGEGNWRQAGRRALLQAGDLLLCDADRPYEVSFPDKARTLLIRIEKQTLRRYIPQADAFLCQPLSGHAGAGELVSRMLRTFWAAPEQSLSPESAPRMSKAILELLGAAYAPLAPSRLLIDVPRPSLRNRTLLYIEGQLGDPDLTPSRIATALGVSSGHLHRAFTADGVTLAQHLRQRRLERAHAALADPLLLRRSVSRIAREQGFKTLAHFSRCFRSAYGLSPRAHRKLALGSCRHA